MIYLISDAFIPNTAPTNRFLSLIKGFEELDVKYKVVFVKPNREFDKPIGYSNISYLWNTPIIKNYYIRLILYLIWSRELYKIKIKKFIRELTPTDSIVLFSPIYVHIFLQNKRNVKIFHERTEHPYVYNCFNNRKKTNRYINECNQIDGLFTISETLKKSFVELGTKDSIIHVINMIVDISRFANLEKTKVNDNYIAYCGTISNNKDGVDLLIKSFEIVARENKSIKLYIIGNCPSTIEAAENIQLINELKLQRRIIFTGIISAERMPQVLKNAKLLALARPNSVQAANGFPTKLGEYLLTKNPVVITNTGDIPLFLKDKENALLVEPGNIKEFADKIIWALNNPNESIMIGLKGAEIAYKHFNNIIEAQKMYDIICHKD